MDNPTLPENEIQEATWQEDENRATLFLRSVFVVLSGALILGAERNIAFDSSFLKVLYLLGMNVILPVFILWLFFGQGLRPVEWLSDQKYNAWNYGINFKDWKTHLKWAGILCIFGILLCFLSIAFLSSTYYIVSTCIKFFIFLAIEETNPFLFICGEILLGASFVWLIWGYLLFGCVQGFSKIPTFILIILAIVMPAIIAIRTTPTVASVLTVVCFILFYFLSFIGCWKTKSIAPVLYSMFFLAIITFLIAISPLMQGFSILN